MATYNVGGLNPFSKVKNIWEAVDKARSGDEINWNKVDKYEGNLNVSQGIHIFGNNKKFKIPEHGIGFVLDGSGNFTLEGVTIEAVTLSNAIRIMNWRGTITLRKCNITYKKKLREDKCYPIIQSDGYLKDLRVIIEDSILEGVYLSASVLEVSNSYINGRFVDGNLDFDRITVSSSQVDRMLIKTDNFTANKSLFKGSIKVMAQEGAIRNSFLGKEQEKSSIHFSGNIELSNNQIVDVSNQLRFSDGIFTFSDIILPQILMYSKDCELVFKENVFDNAEWSQENTKIANQGSEELQGVHKVQSARDELGSLIGQPKVKALFDNMISTSRVSKAKMNQGINVDEVNFHSVFSGSPGTGKTTVAKLFGKALFEEGILETSKFIKVGRRDLVGDHIGETAINTGKYIEEAKGGVLFIDEAYSLYVDDSDKDYGKEAINTIVDYAQEVKGDTVIILAGYTDEMQNMFNKANPGLNRRFATWVEFEDYSFEELLEIMHLMMKDYNLPVATKDKMKILLFALKKRNLVDGNAGFIENFVQAILMEQSARLDLEGKFDKESLLTIMPNDVTIAYNKIKESTENKLGTLN